MPIQRDNGAAAEYYFAAEMLRRGITPAWPSSETKPYDMILDLGASRAKVQVKSSIKVGESISVQFMMSSGSAKRRYNNVEIDFIVLYLFHHDVWYIFPVRDVETGVTVHPGDPRCKYAKYLEAWHLLVD